ncbi:conserved hypothetical protein [Hahella chejuensis KCTC 2396]|uniref:DUF3857 domain-containing protein n=1 Tax=Hahella chejuensis (strain KCTC 2396) TaxID=349521 RepID=Q2S737_HAHCH|nr:DUF3857 domain-containing transglutaminase family protein [Hahella chejuensis]ABC33537.1 conserved hypothetical protein [Hahella chejuensis KCTC 2396]
MNRFSGRLYGLIATLSVMLACQANGQTFKSNGYAYDISAAPKWVESVQAPAAPGHDNGAVEYLLVDRQTSAATRSPQYFYHFVERANNLDGLEEISHLKVTFNPDFQQLIWHKLNVIRDGKVIDRLDPQSITLIREETELNQEMFSGYVTSVVFVKGTRVGDVVDFSYSIVGRNPVFGDHYFQGLSMSWQAPVHRLYTRVIAPPNRELRISAVKYDAQPTISAYGKSKVYVWDDANVAAYYNEGNYPLDYEPGSFISLTDFPDWDGVIRWAEPLYAVRPIKSKELRDLRDELKSMPKEQAVITALQFAQEQIRYLGIELGQNSHLPRAPDMVIENRYGDCKDKTLLLVSLLRSIGIDAYPALVSWEIASGVDKIAPSPGGFDHVITLVELDGQRYWLDPTRRYQKGSLNTLGYYDYGKALIIGHPSERELVKVGLPEVAGVPSMITRERFKVIDYSAPVEHFITTEYTGIEADRMRQRLANKSIREFSQDMLNYMQKLYPGAEQLEPVQITDDGANNRFIIDEHYRINDFYAPVDNVQATRFYAYSLFEYVKSPAVTRRSGPLTLPGPIRVVHDISLEYPSSLKFTDQAAKVSQSNDYFNYFYQEDYLGRTLNLHHELEFKRAAMPAEATQSFLDLKKQINNSGEHYYQVTRNEETDKSRFGDFISSIQSVVYGLEAPQ